MTFQDEMAQAHARDYAEQNQLRALRGEIACLLRENPSVLSQSTRSDLARASAALWNDMLRIDERWN